MIFLSVFPFKQTTVVLYTDYIFGWGFRSGFCKRKLSNLSSAIGGVCKLAYQKKTASGDAGSL